MSEVEALLDAGEDPNVITEHSESPLRVASNNGRFDVIKLLLSRGGDETQLRWTNLFHVIAYGGIENLEDIVTSGVDLENKDGWERTPLLFSILVGDIQKTALLLKAGANVTAVGRCGKVPLAYAIQKDNLPMLDWLIGQGFDPEQRDGFNNTPLIEAAKCGAVKCLNSLIAKDVDIFAKNDIPHAAIECADNLDVMFALIKAGADINEISRERRAELLGYRIGTAPDVLAEEYFQGRNRVFGRSNPERANNPFWHAMVKCGGSGYQATNKFEPNSGSSFKNGPAWSFDRFGKSISPLPDGRFLEI
ncbi:MAG: ankyrin repeat domain-containing protein, partial [Rhodobacteraceae bacterium]|nr:ankyrin repeat domain-containing protein [Paracoccaceae bacterium]